jgi:hypothetical protein
MSTINNITG